MRLLYLPILSPHRPSYPHVARHTGISLISLFISYAIMINQSSFRSLELSLFQAHQRQCSYYNHLDPGQDR